MVTKRRRYAWLGLVTLLLALAAMLPATAGADEGDEQNVHPAVDVYAELFPGDRVPVITNSVTPVSTPWRRTRPFPISGSAR